MAKRINSRSTSSPLMIFFLSRRLKGSKTLIFPESLLISRCGVLAPLTVLSGVDSVMMLSRLFWVISGNPSLIRRIVFLPGRSFIMFATAKTPPIAFSNLPLSTKRYSCSNIGCTCSPYRSTGVISPVASIPNSCHILSASCERSYHMWPEAKTKAFLTSFSSVVKD